MIDIEDINKKYTMDITAATIGNKLEKEIGIVCICSHFTWKDKTIFHATFGGYSTPITCEAAAKILSAVPQTEKLPIDGINGKEFQDYKIISKRGYRDTYSKLEVRYLSDGIEISFCINLEENKSIMGLFIRSNRQLTSSEISTYNIRGSRYAGRVCDMKIPQFIFSGGRQIHYQGGDVVCNENAIINQVISAIQYAGEFSAE